MFDLESFCKVNGINMTRNNDFGHTIFRKGELYFFCENEMVDKSPVNVSLHLIHEFELI